MSSDTYTDQKSSKGGILRKILMILIPILIVVGFIVAASIIIKINKKPEEKERTFNTLAVIAAYATSDNVKLEVNASGCNARAHLRTHFLNRCC